MATPIASTTAAVRAHPAGAFSGTTGVVVGLLVSYAHLTADQAGAIIAGLGLVTTGISYLASHGGVAGLWHELIHGAS